MNIVYYSDYKKRKEKHVFEVRAKGVWTHKQTGFSGHYIVVCDNANEQKEFKDNPQKHLARFINTRNSLNPAERIDFKELDIK